MGILENHQQNSILYPRPRRIDGKEEARKALAKVHGKTKKHETTKHYLTLELSKGVTVEGTKEGFFIEGPLRVEIIDSKTLRIHKREE